MAFASLGCLFLFSRGLDFGKGLEFTGVRRSVPQLHGTGGRILEPCLGEAVRPSLRVCNCRDYNQLGVDEYNVVDEVLDLSDALRGSEVK